LFTNILFSPLGDKRNPAAVRRIGDLSGGTEAKLTLFGVVPEPSRLQRVMHRSATIDALLHEEREAMSARLRRCTPKADHLEIETMVAVGDPALNIIERVLQAEHDLVVVTTDDDDEDQATIKRLLRKCPCPVWVIRPTRARIQRLLVAINPEPAEAELNRRMLELATALFALGGGELHLVHAWELYGEATMRSSAFLHTSAHEIEGLLNNEQAHHRRALDDLLVASGLADQPWEIHLHKGPAADVVRTVAARHRINLLVMGTVARTGVAGLIMGNTAESVLDRVRCSVIALKPAGFVSPAARVD
jgi:nucleotide-binding universal stress UspA family protein